ncbi:VOC family protein [Snuella sedimenti]|uniref:VOC family protein n=1 Tax=Snuella sedimenti TaxID=2798802 RepID=A0A8J7INT7_9FLAO|nr:VOC family protein [Snuella sedimenti]MBJ6368112.1 VOC family protein [Snuella sedimenti]
MLIKEITLFTNNILRQKEFYRHILDFELVFDSADKIAFNSGDSVLSFQYKEAVKPSHLAFNIPSNKIEGALQWLQRRVEILPDGDNLIIDFKNWNAKAIYFYDADKNIMEFIARKDLGLNSRVNFSSASVLSISEIGIATTNIEAIYNQINAIKAIPVFDGNFQRFCAVGNDMGLFILINKTAKKWFPTREEAFTSEFIIKGDYNFSFINGEIKEIS